MMTARATMLGATYRTRSADFLHREVGSASDLDPRRLRVRARSRLLPAEPRDGFAARVHFSWEFHHDSPLHDCDRFVARSESAGSKRSSAVGLPGWLRRLRDEPMGGKIRPLVTWRVWGRLLEARGPICSTRPRRTRSTWKRWPSGTKPCMPAKLAVREEKQTRGRQARSGPRRRVERMDLRDGITLNNLLAQIFDIDPTAVKSGRANAPISMPARSRRSPSSGTQRPSPSASTR